MFCYKCGCENPDNSSSCKECGAVLSGNASRFCPICGKANDLKATFCENCGVVLAVATHPGLPTHQAPPSHGMVYAGFWLRLVASLIDGAILNVVMTPLYFIMFIPMFLSAESGDEEFALLMMPLMCFFYIAAFIASWLYFSWMESSKYQATLGKMALGIIVTDLDGNRIDFGRATGRTFAKILSGLILDIGYIMAGFTEKKQGLHDIIAGCLVVMKR